MRTSRLLLVAVLSASSMTAQTVVPVAPFQSIELHRGRGHVLVRHGQTQRVTIVDGDLQFTRVRLDDGRLIIENCKPDCPRGYRLRLEVITPELASVSVSNGGMVQSVGSFPVQTAIEADVENGGMIDIRSIAADTVDASVDSGGAILTNARQTLTATIDSGGNITYWGDPRVRRSVRDGGVVKRGAPQDAQKPISEFRHDVIPIPPIPPTPPVPPAPPR